MDSILAPISEEKSERLAKIEIELYQIAVSAAAARAGDYADGHRDWYWQWLARLRLGPSQPDDRVSQAGRVTTWPSRPTSGGWHSPT